MSLLHDCRKFCFANGLLSCQAVIAGVSGGADSMCLLDILYSMSKESGKKSSGKESTGKESSGKDDSLHAFPKIIAAHVNHGLRADAADHDEELVRQYCQARDIPFFVLHADIRSIAGEKKISLEQAGRDVRYAFFEETAEKFRSEAGPVFTAVAHHREDQAETILMNLFRGTGPDGLCGMRPRSADIIRPLLFASKEDIRAYNDDNKLEFSEDLSNFDNIYTRNRWRNQIMPLIADVSRKDPVLPLLAFSDLASTDKEYFDEKVLEIFHKNAYQGGSGSYGLPCSVIRAEHRAIASRLVRFLYTTRFSSGTDLSSAHVASILALTAEDSNGRRISLAHGKEAYLAEGMLFIDRLSDRVLADDRTWNTRNGQVLLCKEEAKGEILLEFNSILSKRVVDIPKTYFEVEVILVENPQQVVYNSRTWYCPAEVLRGAVFRTRKQGDWFSRAGSTGGKPLRRFLTDRKIPDFVRDRMLIASLDSQVLWIPGVSFAAGFADEISGRRYFESRGLEMNTTSVQDTELYRITIIDRNEQEEH